MWLTGPEAPTNCKSAVCVLTVLLLCYFGGGSRGLGRGQNVQSINFVYIFLSLKNL